MDKAVETFDDATIDRALKAMDKTWAHYGLCHTCRTMYPVAHGCSERDTFGKPILCVCLPCHPERRQNKERAGLRAALRELLQHG